MVTVVAALIEKEGKVLIARRNDGNEKVIGKWEFPGGKAEPGETEEETVEREVQEELSLQVKAKEYIGNSVYEYPNRVVNLKLYRCEYLAGTIHLEAHSEYRWVSKNALTDYDLAPADIPLAQKVKQIA